MVAPRKGIVLSASQRIKVVNDIYRDIKAHCKKFEERNVIEVPIEVWEVGHGERPFGTHGQNAYIDMTIKVLGKEYKGLGTRDCETLGRELKELCKDFMVETKGITLGYGKFAPDFNFPTIIRKFGKPCQSFTKLNATLRKTQNKELSLSACYYVNLFGKRGNYDESGNRTYLAFNEEKCAQILEWLRSTRNSRDIVEMEVTTSDYIDDLDYSIRNETECYGSRKVMPHITIKTPKGKLKGEFNY